MRRAIVGINPEYLRRALKLPKNSKIVNVIWSSYTHSVDLVMECEDFEDVPEGFSLPNIFPAWEFNGDGSSQFHSW